MRLVTFLLTTLALAPNLFCQPEVHPDRRVTLRITAPKATEVTLNRDWADGVEKLSKGDGGIWSITVGPLAPASYIYSFNVDGITMADPINPRIKLRARGSGSLFDVPGEKSEIWQARDVPHGAVEINWTKSAVLNGETRWFWVYTPPGYAKETSRKYPVLYLLHGSNDTAAGWTTAGSVNFIFDNLLADKKMVPMAVVMPFGHALPFGSRGTPSNTAVFQDYLLKDVVPAAEAKYRIQPGREHRAIAGLSMGGEQSQTIGFGHPELFSAVGAFSASYPRELPEGWAPKLKGKMKVIWMGCGLQDPSHIAATRKVAESLKGAGVPYTYDETEGAHNFAMWQQHIAKFAPLLFK